jgi:hypothetical protein
VHQFQDTPHPDNNVEIENKHRFWSSDCMQSREAGYTILDESL